MSMWELAHLTSLREENLSENITWNYPKSKGPYRF
jgi:hypothetical protein